jgi:hypothetical protein
MIGDSDVYRVIGLFIGLAAMVFVELGPEIHFDSYGLRHRDGTGFHFEMSRTTSGTNFQFGQPTLR